MSTWMDKVIKGQECIVPEFGLGRVMDFGHESGTCGYDYIAVKFYHEEDIGTPAGIYRRFAPEAVNLIDPSGLILAPYKAREEKKKRANKYSEKPKASSPSQSRAFGFRAGSRIAARYGSAD